MKKLLSLTISIMLILLSAFSQTGFAANETNALEKEITILSQLGYIQSTPENINSNLSRGQFTQILVSIMNGDIIDTADTVIVDINEFHDYYPAMSRAIKLGLINGPVTRADDNITYNEAIKMAVCMVGYNQYALYKGGWPNGYREMAYNIGLLKHMTSASGDAYLTWKDAIVLLYNAISVDVLEPVSVGSNTTYATVEGRTILSQYHSIIAAEGIVESVKGKSLENIDNLKEGEIIIDGKKLTSDFPEMSKYVGLNVLYYYDDNNDTLCAIYPENNKVVKINAESVYQFNSRELVYDEEVSGKQNSVERKISFSQKACILYNDVVIDSFDSSYFLDKQGEFTFIDNNRDDKYDVVMLDITEDYVVKKTDTYFNTIYDFYDTNKNLCLSDNNGVNVSFVDSYGRPMLISELMRYDVISVKKSFDGKKITAIFSNHEIRGTVEGVVKTGDKMYLTIRGVNYETTSDFAKYEKIKIGEWGVFGITTTGKIACINREFTEEGSFYGYLIKAARDSGLNPQLRFRILNQNGEIVILVAAKKIAIDGVSMKADEAYQYLGGTITKSQPVVYDVNKDGFITGIDTTIYNDGLENKDSLREMYNCYDSSYDEEGNATEISKTKLEWRSGTGIFGSKIATQSGTVFFKVGHSCNSPDDEFKVADLSSLTQNSYSFKAYKTVEDSPIANIIVMYSSDASDSTGNTHYLISKVTESMDENGTFATKLYLYAGANERIYYVRDKSVFSNAKWCDAGVDETGLNHNFVAGDIIKLTTDAEGFVNKIELVYDRIGNEFYKSTYQNTPAANEMTRISFNEVYLNYSGIMLVHKGPIPEGTDSIDFDKLESYNASGFTVLVFDPDEKNETVRLGNISDLSDYRTTGKGSMIFLQTTYTTNGIIIIYRNLQK